MVEQTKILVFAGPPGSGKGFHSQWLIKKYRFGYVASGDLCRRYQDYFDPIKKQTVAQIIQSGEMVSSHLIGDLISKAITENILNHVPVVIVDGFPRNLEQHQLWKQLISKKQWNVVFFFLECDPTTAFQRVTNRLICSQCGLVYNIAINRPLQSGICDRDQGQLVQRSDDSRFQIRMNTFYRETEPMIQWLIKEKVTYKTFRVGTGSTEKVRKQMVYFLQNKRWI